MHWKDEGYLLSKTNFNENSIIIEAFTLNHGKYSGIVYGGSSRKKKRIFQIGNKILLNWKSKSENKLGYFDIELTNPISPFFFDDKKRSICILAATTILKILLPERQINKKIYNLFEKLINQLNNDNWIKSYILWELSLIKELGFEVDFFNIKQNNQNKDIKVNEKFFKVPKLILESDTILNFSNVEIKDALKFNKNLIMENFIHPYRLKFPISRSMLEKYYN